MELKRIASFNADHRKIIPGVYVSRVDGDVTSYDMRFKKPNTGELLSNAEMHSVEHIFATLVRNSPVSDRVVYFGPMGCQTGFYLLLRDMSRAEALELIKSTSLAVARFDGEMPGKSEIECGNYINLDVAVANRAAEAYFEAIKDWTVEKMDYVE